MDSPSEPIYPMISVAELREVINLLSKAPTTVGDGFAMNDLLNRLVTLANQSHPIGAVVPRGVSQLPEGKQAETDLSGKVPTSPEG